MGPRARRRHHLIRIKRRVRRYYGGRAKDNPRHLGRTAHTRQLCSCWMCGNPRRYLGELSLQERRAFQPDDPWEENPVRGQPSPRVLGLVVEWAAQHRRELGENWDMAVRQGPLKGILPLE